jgi:hypothetical protein
MKHMPTNRQSLMMPADVIRCKYSGIRITEGWLTGVYLVCIFILYFQSLSLEHRTNFMVFGQFTIYGRTPWTSVQPVARPQPARDNIQTKDKQSYPTWDSNTRSRVRAPKAHIATSSATAWLKRKLKLLLTPEVYNRMILIYVRSLTLW